MSYKIVKFTISALLVLLAVSWGSPASASDSRPSTLLPTHPAILAISATSKNIVTVSGANKSATVIVMNRKKIDPSLLIELECMETSGQLANEVSVIIRSESVLNAEQRSEIERNGGKINSIAGDILTAVIPGSNIPAIADLKFILYIEKSKSQKLR